MSFQNMFLHASRPTVWASAIITHAGAESRVRFYFCYPCIIFRQIKQNVTRIPNTNWNRRKYRIPVHIQPPPGPSSPSCPRFGHSIAFKLYLLSHKSSIFIARLCETLWRFYFIIRHNSSNCSSAEPLTQNLSQNVANLTYLWLDVFILSIYNDYKTCN